MCPIEQPLKSKVVATVWRRMWGVTLFLSPARARIRMNQLESAVFFKGLPPGIAKRAFSSSLRGLTYSLTQLSARGVKNTVRCLLPFPIMVASPDWKLMEERVRDRGL